MRRIEIILAIPDVSETFGCRLKSTPEDDISTLLAKSKLAGHWGEKSESIPHHIRKVGTGWTKCTPSELRVSTSRECLDFKSREGSLPRHS